MSCPIVPDRFNKSRPDVSSPCHLRLVEYCFLPQFGRPTVVNRIEVGFYVECPMKVKKRSGIVSM